MPEYRWIPVAFCYDSVQFSMTLFVLLLAWNCVASLLPLIEIQLKQTEKKIWIEIQVQW